MLLDLSMPLDARTPVYPGDPGFTAESIATLGKDGFRVHRLELGTHLGTHLDAPAHMLADGAGVESLALDRLVGPACVLDLRGLPRIGVEHMPDRLAAPRVLLFTGHSAGWRDPAWITGPHPRLADGAARRLVDLGACLVGVDSFCLDAPPWAVHHILLRAGIPLVENLVHLDRLPPVFRLIVAPLPLTGLDGAPARVFAETGSS